MGKVITDVRLRNAKPRTKLYRIAAGNGLALEVTPGGSKLWRWRYRFAGKARMLALGAYPSVSLEAARKKRNDLGKLLADGIDPSAQRREARETAALSTDGTFAAAVERWKDDELAPKSEEYRLNVTRMLDRDVLPYIGARPMTEIKPRELIAVFERIRSRGVDETARRARSIVGQVYRYAIRRGLADVDPTQPLRGERRAQPIKHFAAFTNPADVARLMQAVYDYKGTPEVRAALKLSALLFQRPGEIRRMQWTEIDFEAAQWRYVVSKTNTPHIVPLCSQALAVLRELRPLTDGGLSLKPDAPRYVLPSPKSRLRPLSENAVRVALRNMGFTNDEMTAHGFRAMARSLLAELGWKPDAIERQLSHKASGPLGAAYDRAAYLDERKAMMSAWADYLDTLRTRSNVVALRTARAS
jgi:integrase